MPSEKVEKLDDSDILWLIDIAKSAAFHRPKSLPMDVTDDEVKERLKVILTKLEQPRPPLELLIYCPRCLKQHVDEGKFAKKPHKTHACQFCGLAFQASGPVESIGVQFFRGYKNESFTISHPPGSKPHVSEPTLLPGQALVYVGRKVRFKEGARELGYDTEKTFEIAAFTDAGEGKTKVRLVSDDDDWIPSDLLEAAPP